MQGPEGQAPNGGPRRRRRRRRGRRGGSGNASAAGTPAANADGAGAPRSDPDSKDATPRATKARADKSRAGKPHGGKPHGGKRGHRGRARARRLRDDEPVYAALDLGTNNCRLLVAQPTRYNFRVVDAFSRVVRLGEGLSSAGVLSDGAMTRALEALNVCRDKLVINGVNRHRFIATEACRQARNGDVFLDRVKQETGLTLEVVSREAEAHLAVAGCASLIDPQASGVVVFDIGGGSTELVVLDLARVGGRDGDARGSMSHAVVGWTSLPVGVVGIAERHGGVRVDGASFNAMVAEVADMLAEFDAAGALDGHARDKVHLLGTSGTVTTIAGVHLGLRRYDRRRVDGTWMSPSSIRNVNERLCAMSYEERAANACIGRDRADLVLAGCAIFEAIRQRWPWARVRVADRGLREGILMSLMTADGVWSGQGTQRSNGAAPS